MKSASLVAAATGLITTVVATDPLSPGQCTLQGRECEWFGASPFCGSTNSRLGDLDPEGREYYTSTETLTWSDLCEEPTRGKDPETDCCNAYGSRCWGGYKRLWCKPKPESEPSSKPKPESESPKPEPEQLRKPKPEPEQSSKPKPKPKPEPDFYNDAECYKVTYDWGPEGTEDCPLETGCEQEDYTWTWEYVCARTCFSRRGKWGVQFKTGDCDPKIEDCRVATSGPTDSRECVERDLKPELTIADPYETTDATQWNIYGQGVFVRMGSSVLATAAPGSKAILNFTSKHNPDTMYGHGIMTEGAKDAHVHDFVFSSNLTFPAKSAPGNAGLVFRVSNPGPGVDEYRGYYAGIEWAGVDSVARLVLGTADNDWRLISAANLGVASKPSFAIKVQAVGSWIKIFVDDWKKPVIRVKNNKYRSGRVGLRTFNVEVKYSNIGLKRIPQLSGKKSAM